MERRPCYHSRVILDLLERQVLRDHLEGRDQLESKGPRERLDHAEKMYVNVAMHGVNSTVLVLHYNTGSTWSFGSGR